MIVTDLSKFDSYMFNLLVHKVSTVKADYDADVDDRNQFLKGSRYNNDQRIARMVLGYFFADSSIKRILSFFRLYGMNLFSS